MTQAPRPRKIERTDGEMAQSLQRHVRLLDAFYQKAVLDRDEDYWGGVAAEVRVLVTESRLNHPLLLGLMRKYEPEITWPTNLMSHAELASYMDGRALWFDRGALEGQQVTRMQLIRTWAEQHGAAHEDWALDESFLYALESEIHANGYTQLMGLMIDIVSEVLKVAEEFVRRLQEVRPDLFERRREARPWAPPLFRTV